jgi:pimeloyl-ACP methyl ester carboxylesterase
VQAGDIAIRAGDVSLDATVTVPPEHRGIVVFAHGSGSGRHSPRNQFVATVLNDSGFATVLADLLTPEEERIDARTAEHRFDIPLLAGRVIELIHWVTGDVGLFGASTGAAAALMAAAERASSVKAVVSRGGRPDLAGEALPGVEAATLLIVGGRDETVLDLNRKAQENIRAVTRLDVIPGATHLFEEPGALERVADLAAAWFAEHLLP